MSEIPNAAKGAAREKMREAKARGETLKYTDALASVLDAEAVEQSPKTQLVSRLRAALNHLNEAMRDNPCYTDETRRQARTVVTNIIRTSEGKSSRVFPICIRGYKSTGGYRLAAGIYNALVKGGVVPEAEPVSFRGENDLSDMCLKGEHPTFLIMRGDYAQESEHHLDNINLFLFRSGETRCETNAVTFVMVGASNDFDHVYVDSTNRIRTHLPSKKGETAQIYAEHELGYVLTSNALKEFEDAMDAVQGCNDRHFYDKVSWIDVAESIVNRAVDVHLDKLIIKDTDDFDTNVYAEDINQAAKDMFFVNYGPAMADENPLPTILTAAWGDGKKSHSYLGPNDIEKKTGADWTPEWNWKNSANKGVPLGTKLDPERGIPAHDVVSVQPRGNGVISGFQGSGYTNVARNFIVSAAAQYSPQDLSFAVFNGKEGGPIQVEGAKLGVSRLPHVVAEFDDEQEFSTWVRHMSDVIQEARDEGRKAPKLCVFVVGEMTNSTAHMAKSSDPLMAFVQVSPDPDITADWGVLMAGSKLPVIRKFRELHAPGTGNALLYYSQRARDASASRDDGFVFRMFGDDDEDVEELIDRICDYHVSLEES